jgi:hypothetical protein
MESSDFIENAISPHESSLNLDARLLLLHPSDNVLILTCNIDAGEPYHLDGRSFLSTMPLGLGHKIARVDIPAGGKILKYGVSIGSAIVPISVGEHVHLHNLKSDYLPTYTLDKEHRYGTASH